LIRASQGIVFPDGSIQYSAATRTFGAKSSLPGGSLQSTKSGKKHSGGQEHIEAISQDMIAKFQGGTLTNSSIFDNGSIGIGTIAPDSFVNIQGRSLRCWDI
jgi:hypothetical protein